MPLRGKSLGEDISEFHKGETYNRTKEKFGKKRADKQAIAVAYSAKRKKTRSSRRSR